MQEMLPQDLSKRKRCRTTWKCCRNSRNGCRNDGKRCRKVGPQGTENLDKFNHRHLKTESDS